MNRYKVVGIMSGTSMDGVDLALCSFAVKKGKWTFRIDSAEIVPYANQQKKHFEKLAGGSAENLAEAHVLYGRFLGNLIEQFLARNKAKADFISSHGHTLFHQPSKHFTTQVGDGAALSAACGLPVVCDFRSADVALGGQGAPLVPVGDHHLFNQYRYCLNLGGIANVSFERSGNRIAFDICPVNLLLNKLALEKGKNYDPEGKMAAHGVVQKKLLDKLNSVSFYKKHFPKSLGREDIEKHFLRTIDNDRSSVEDKLRTCCEHIAIQIAAVTDSAGKMLVTGGGVYNSFLIERIGHFCKPAIVIPPNQLVEFKEALIFAFLGVLRWRNEINCLSSVTGASRDSSGGAIYHP